MAADVYPEARDAFLNKALGWLVDDFAVVLSGDAPRDTGAVVADDIPNVLGSAPLTGRSMPGGGVAAAADCPVPGVPAGQTVRAVYIVQDSGSPTSDLIVWGSDVHADLLPVNRVSDGNPIVVHWFNGTGNIFRI